MRLSVGIAGFVVILIAIVIAKILTESPLEHPQPPLPSIVVTDGAGHYFIAPTPSEEEINRMAEQHAIGRLRYTTP